MEASQADSAAEIMADLDHRLRRLEFYLTGALDIAPSLDGTVNDAPSLYTRLESIKSSIGKVTSERKSMGDMLRLCSSRDHLKAPH